MNDSRHFFDVYDRTSNAAEADINLIFCNDRLDRISFRKLDLIRNVLSASMALWLLRVVMTHFIISTKQ